jgi:hypothetical protein
MENTLGFRSTTEEVKHLIMMFMGTEEKEVERRVLVKHIKENLKDNPSLTDGVIAGAIKILVNSGELIVVHRGCYKKGMVKVALSPLEQICQVCIRFNNSLEKACTVNAMELSDKEKLIYEKFIGYLMDGYEHVHLMLDGLQGLLDGLSELEACEKDLTKDASIAPSFLFLEEEKEKLEGQENSVVKPGKEQEKEEKSIHEPGKEQEKENSLMENKTAGHKKTSKSNKKEN